MLDITINYNRLKLFVVLFLLQVMFYSLSVNAAKPYEFSSNVSSCYYGVVGKKADGTTYNSSRVSLKAPECQFNLSLGPTGLNLPDGVYNLYFKASDSTTLPSSNDMTQTLVGTYHIDMTAPVCTLNSLELVGIKNQYYNDGKLYYKSGDDAKGKIVLKVSCKDTDYPSVDCYGSSCVSGLDKANIDFPKILGASPTYTISGGNLVSDFILTYNWSGKQIEATNILNKVFISDVAGNEAKLTLSSNSKIIFRKDDGTNIGSVGVTTLRLWPDDKAPVISGNVKYVNQISGISKDLNENSVFGSTYFAAYDSKELLIPGIEDETSGLSSFDLNIEKSSEINKYKTYSYSNSTISLKSDFSQTKINHDFSDVSQNGDYNSLGYREYGIYLSSKFLDGTLKDDYICDMVGNCKNISYKDIRVVADIPNLKLTTQNTSLNNGGISNYSDENLLSIGLKDKYLNEVVPVSGVKNISIKTTFINTLGLNQLDNVSANSGDGVGYRFTDGNNNNISFNSDINYKQYSTTLTQKSYLDGGKLNIFVKSAVPTHGEYITAKDNPGEKEISLYGTGSSLAKLSFDKLGIDINSSTYNGVGEMSDDEFFTNNYDFKFKPVLSFNYISNIYPIVEGQYKNMTLKNFSQGNSLLSDYKFSITTGTLNEFLQIFKSKLSTGNISDGNWSADSKTNTYKIGRGTTSLSSSVNGKMSLNSQNIFQIISQSISGISETDNGIALYSTLEYIVNGKTVKLPGIQTGFTSYGKHVEQDFQKSSKYMDKSEMLFSEIDVSGITQTNNTKGSTSGAGAVTTDNSTFNDFSSITLYDLKTNITKNVSTILGGNNKQAGKVGNSTIKISNFSGFNSNQGLVLKGGDLLYIKDNNVEINCSGACGITGKKTIIVENGNLTINTDMYYKDNNSVLGIILVGNSSNGNKSKVKINENITNGVGIIYSDGPIVSVDNDGNIYDGYNVGTNLINQLYWKGSFITRNTVGGSITNINCPYGTPEYDKTTCTQEVAQRYDLIYLRRYARVNEFTYFSSNNNPMGDGKVPIFYDSADTLISGGRIIKKDSNMTTGNNNLSKSNKFDAPLILDFDSRIQLNPPYGFEQ